MRNDMTKDERALRQGIIDQCNWMNAAGLNQGTSGNISARYGDTMLLTPSATAYDSMTPEMIVSMPLEGEYGAWSGPLTPSSEWRFHLDILRARPEINAIVHTHATYCTILSIGRRDIPAVHYMIANFGGATVRCGEYARYGSKELSENALAALQDRTGCLLANHGMLVLGKSLKHAMWLAVELETLAKQYYHSLVIGDYVVLPDDEVMGVKDKMATGYGFKELKKLGDGAAVPTAGGKKPAKPSRAKRAKVATS
jgi:L-fuculose-phosphate aldolase